MSDKLPYQFTLARLITLEFALIDKNYKEKKPINVNANLSFAAVEKHRVIAVGAKFQFEIDNQPFIVIKVEGQFVVPKETWDSLMKEDEKVIVPKQFMAHLAMLVVGSSRGVLHAKLENTAFNQFLIPTINVQSMIQEDIEIELSADSIDEQN